MTTPVQIPSEFDDLPEPGRSKAFELLKELLESGADEATAIEQAREQARSWIAERVRAPADACGILPHGQDACVPSPNERPRENNGDSENATRGLRLAPDLPE